MTRDVVPESYQAWQAASDEAAAAMGVLPVPADEAAHVSELIHAERRLWK